MEGQEEGRGGGQVKLSFINTRSPRDTLLGHCKTNEPCGDLPWKGEAGVEGPPPTTSADHIAVCKAVTWQEFTPALMLVVSLTGAVWKRSRERYQGSAMSFQMTDLHGAQGEAGMQGDMRGGKKTMERLQGHM